MIRSELHVTVECDRCTDGLTDDHDRSTGRPTSFLNRPTALAALAAALTSGGWVRLFDGRLLCPTCAAEQTCRDRGHEYARDGWRMCACRRSIPAHADALPDPAGGDGCGITWRLCGRCDHIDEHHVTDSTRGHDDGHDESAVLQVQPGGHLRQDVPAGLALPTHTPAGPRTSRQETSKETPMVDRDRRPDGGAVTGAPAGARLGGAR